MLSASTQRYKLRLPERIISQHLSLFLLPLETLLCHASSAFSRWRAAIHGHSHSARQTHAHKSQRDPAGPDDRQTGTQKGHSCP